MMVMDGHYCIVWIGYLSSQQSNSFSPLSIFLGAERRIAEEGLKKENPKVEWWILELFQL